MIRLHLLLIFSASYLLAGSQSGPFLFSGTSYISCGQIGLLVDNAEAGIVLPVRLAEKTSGGWSASAALRPGFDDLLELAAAAHLPLPWKDQVALGIQHTGIEGYAEQRITFSYARKLFRQLNAAIQFDVNRNSAIEYKDLYGASWSVSLHAPMMKAVSMSAFIYNPLGDISELDLPSVARIGVAYHPSEKVNVALEGEKDWQHALRLKAGIHYRLHPSLGLMWGVGTQPSTIHAGISWNLVSSMAVSGGSRYHTSLGSILSASISQYKLE